MQALYEGALIPNRGSNYSRLKWNWDQFDVKSTELAREAGMEFEEKITPT